MRTRITDTIGRRAPLGAGLSAAAGLWLVAVEAGGHGWLSRWLLVVLVGAPTAALLAPLATRLVARPARLELEQMAPGEVLELKLDPGEPIESMPRSAEEDGHQVLVDGTDVRITKC